MRPPGLPIELRVEGRRALVVGGAAEAAKRCEALVLAGAKVTVVAETVVPELSRLVASRQIEWHTRAYRGPEDLEGVHLCFLTFRGVPELALALRSECIERRILLWANDAPDLSDLTMPALIESGPVRLAISTGGRDSGLARAVKRAIEPLFDERFGARAQQQLGRHTVPPLRVEGGRLKWD